MLKTKLELITEKAREDRKVRFTSLAHHLNEPFLAECYHELKKRRAAGVDGISVEEYGQNLEGKLKTLVGKLKTKRYFPQPVKRVYIPKGDGKQRPLGIPCVEDRVVQMGIGRILESIFETDFLPVSYGFRPGRSCHDALRKFDEVVMRQAINHVVEVDIKGYFDHINHTWLEECLKQRISDPSFLQVIRRVLKSGVMEEGLVKATEEGSPQGGVCSPILSNIYLHYVLDLWFEKKLKKEMKGIVELIRYADDFVICCQYADEAKRVLERIRERFAKFGLSLAEDKTRICEFGRQAPRNGRNSRAIDFLGFAHYCTLSRKGHFMVGRRTIGKRFRTKLNAISVWLRKIRNQVPIEAWWKNLCLKLKGHYQYYGIMGNYRGIERFYREVKKNAFKWWNRRSQQKSGSWKQFLLMAERHHLPKPRMVRNFSFMATT